MLVITAERLPHDTGTVLSGENASCVSIIVEFTGDPVHWKPDPVHSAMVVMELELKAHV